MVSLPSELVLRPARSTDAAIIRTLVRGARLDPTQLHWQQFWVIVHGGEIVACGQLRRFPGVRELGSLVVEPTWRRQGLAAALIEQLLSIADAPVYLECRAELVPFYERFGFERVAWRALPWPLKLKFGPMAILSRVFRRPGGIMVHRGSISGERSRVPNDPSPS